MSAHLDAKGTSENLVFDMRPGVLFTRVARGWYNIEVLRGFESALTKTARDYFFKQYGLEAIYSGDEENHPQYIEDRSIIEEIFWETTRNILKDVIQRISVHEQKLHSIVGDEGELILLDGFMYDWIEASTGFIMPPKKGNQNDFTPQAIQLRQKETLQVLGFESVASLEKEYGRRLPIFAIIIKNQKNKSAWLKYFQELDLDKRLFKLKNIIFKSTVFLTNAQFDLRQKIREGPNGDWGEYSKILELVRYMIFPKEDWRDKALRGLCFDIYKSSIGDWNLYYKPLLLYASSVAGVVGMLLHGNLPGAAAIIGLLTLGTETAIMVSDIISRAEVGELQEAQELQIIEGVVQEETAGDMAKGLVISLVAAVALAGIASQLGKFTQTGKMNRYIHKYTPKPKKIIPTPDKTPVSQSSRGTIRPPKGQKTKTTTTAATEKKPLTSNKPLSKEEQAKAAIPTEKEVDEILTDYERGIATPDTPADMVGDLFFYKQKRSAIKTLKKMLGKKLKTVETKTPKGADVHPEPTWQAAHSTSVSSLDKGLPKHLYSKGKEMIVRLLPSGKGHKHDLFDNYWQKRFKEISKKYNRTTTTVKEFEEVISEAARKSGAFDAAEAETVVGLIINDLRFQLGLSDDFVLPMPI